jgi:hypothetical protein
VIEGTNLDHRRRHTRLQHLADTVWQHPSEHKGFQRIRGRHTLLLTQHHQRPAREVLRRERLGNPHPPDAGQTLHCETPHLLSVGHDKLDAMAELFTTGA